MIFDARWPLLPRWEMRKSVRAVVAFRVGIVLCDESSEYYGRRIQQKENKSALAFVGVSLLVLAPSIYQVK